MNSKISLDLKSNYSNSSYNSNSNLKKINSSNTQLVDKIYYLLQSIKPDENSLYQTNTQDTANTPDKPITKTDISFLIENPQIKEVFTFCAENLNIRSKDEILDLKKKINFYSLNKESLENIKALNEKKEKLKNLILEKRNKLEEVKQNKQKIIESKYQIIDQINKNKSKEETNLLKIKILEESKKKIQDMVNDFSMYSLIENYKYLNKINLVIRSDLSFEDFLDHNQKLFEEKIRLDQSQSSNTNINTSNNSSNKFPVYTEEELNLLMVQNLPMYIKTIKQKISELEEKIKLSSYDYEFIQNQNENQNENEKEKEKLSNECDLIISEINEHYQKMQLELIEKFDQITNSNSSDSNYDEKLNFLKNQNSNLIKSYKISPEVVEYYKQTSLVSINNHLEKILSEIKSEHEFNENKNSKKFIYYNKIVNREYSTDSTTTLNNLSYLKDVLKLFKKNKQKIDNFTTKYFLPLAGVIDEKYNDLQNSFKNELELFKNFNPEILTFNKDKNLYDIKDFGYDTQLLRNIGVRNKYDAFNLFYEITGTKYSNMIKYKETQSSLERITVSSPYWKRMKLISEKLGEIYIFLNKEFKQIINEFKLYLKSINTSITDSSDFKKFQKIISVWDKKDFIEFIKEKYSNVIKEINKN